VLTQVSSWTAAIPHPNPWRKIVRWQTRLAQRFDRLLPREFRIDGNRDFVQHLVPEYLQRGSLIYDVGGGKNPLIDRQRKAELKLRIAAVDIDAAEMAAAPEGCYDRTICCDISTYRGEGEADLVICQALLEHVPDTEQALEAISTILKPEGRALIFVPSRNALYARLNLILPESVKRGILYGVFPEMRRDHGFPAYYDRCTPARIEELARAHGLLCEHRRLYFHSSYFSFCLPLHVLWRFWLRLFRLLAGSEAAETFSMVLRKTGRKPPI
jgi:SAM-dependent methyltransferase